MTQTVLPQLQDIASELAAKEEALVAQLEEVRGKLEGVRAVLPLFGEEGAGASPDVAEDVPAAKTAAKTATKTAKKSTTRKATAASKKADTKEADSSTPAKTQRKPKAKQTKGKKKDGRTASWQKYTRPGVKEKTVPEAVRLVLETQPDKSFKIAEVMDSLFKEGMPKQQYLKARNRISNILSGGVRDGEWYKGERGTYSLLEK